MFIDLNYALSILLHIIILFFLFCLFKTEQQSKTYNEVININLIALKTFKVESLPEKNNFTEPVRKINTKNQANKNKKNFTKSKIRKPKNK